MGKIEIGILVKPEKIRSKIRKSGVQREAMKLFQKFWRPTAPGVVKLPHLDEKF